jgi:hypothetical protein
MMPAAAWAQDAGDGLDSNGLNPERIMGVLPNYGTINTPTPQTAPLTARQKWHLVVVETVDPFNLANSTLGAGFSQIGNQMPSYGEGGVAFAKRFGAAIGDMTSQNIFSGGLLACVLHRDPRYFRKGPQARVAYRLVYSAGQLFLAKQDSGRWAFNGSNIFGMMMGIGTSNLYYPRGSRNWDVMGDRVITSLTGGLIGNLQAEFWPDLQKVLHRHHIPLT